MNTSLIIRSIVTLGSLILCIVLLFIGLGLCIKELKKDDMTNTIPKDILIRSTLILVGSMLAMTVTYSAMHYPEIVGTETSMTQLILASFLFVLKSYGWIVAIPWLMNLFRKTGSRRKNDTDKM